MKAIDLLDPSFLVQRRHLIRPYLRQHGRMLAEKLDGPLAPVYRLASRLGIPITSNSRRLAALRNKHAGRRCFVIGNGPSLRITDLDLLKDEVTIASNKIYLAFGETDWRPTFYTVIDTVVMENTAEAISSLPFPKIFPAGTEHLFGRDANSMFCPMGVDWVNVGDFRPGFSPDIRDKVYGGESVTYFNLQLAYYLGCREIYLIGVDFSFKVPEKKVADASFEYILEGEGEQNHFVKDYRPVGEKWTMPHLREQEMAFDCAREFMRRHGGVIYNASRKSELKVLDRVDFNSLFLR